MLSKEQILVMVEKWKENCRRQNLTPALTYSALSLPLVKDLGKHFDLDPQNGFWGPSALSRDFNKIISNYSRGTLNFEAPSLAYELHALYENLFYNLEIEKRS